MVSSNGSEEHDYKSLYKNEASLVLDGYDAVLDALSAIPDSDDFEPKDVLDGEEVYDSGQVDMWINHFSDYNRRNQGNNQGKSLWDMVIGVLDYWSLVDVKGPINDRSSSLKTKFSIQDFDMERAEEKFEDLEEFDADLELEKGDYVPDVLEKV